MGSKPHFIILAKLQGGISGHFALLFILAFALVAIMPGCKTTSRGTTSLTLKEREPDYLCKKLVATQVQADWFSAKLNLDYQSEDFSMSFSGNIRLQKDSVIWINLKKFGFEVARALLTPDSVFVIDRFNNEFIAEGYDHVSEILSFPANFTMVQNLVLGNPVFFTRELSSEVNGENYRLWTDTERLNGDYLLDGTSYFLKRMAFTEAQQERSFEMSLANHQELNKQRNFSYIREMNMTSRETGKVGIEIVFSDVELDIPKSMPFEIPESYRRSR